MSGKSFVFSLSLSYPNELHSVPTHPFFLKNFIYIFCTLSDLGKQWYLISRPLESFDLKLLKYKGVAQYHLTILKI